MTHNQIYRFVAWFCFLSRRTDCLTFYKLTPCVKLMTTYLNKAW